MSFSYMQKKEKKMCQTNMKSLIKKRNKISYFTINIRIAQTRVYNLYIVYTYLQRQSWWFY